MNSFRIYLSGYSEKSNQTNAYLCMKGMDEIHIIRGASLYTRGSGYSVYGWFLFPISFFTKIWPLIILQVSSWLWSNKTLKMECAIIEMLLGQELEKSMVIDNLISIVLIVSKFILYKVFCMGMYKLVKQCPWLQHKLIKLPVLFSLLICSRLFWVSGKVD